MPRLRASLIIAGLLLVGAGCAAQPATTPPPAASNQPAAIETEGGLQQATIVKMTEDGFIPSTFTIKKGDTVLFTNDGTSPHWPASGPHPTHTLYPEFDPKTGIAPGGNWSFTFEKAGQWPFHDHFSPSHFGQITVTE